MTRYRLSVEHGLARNHRGNPVTLAEAVTHTSSYLCPLRVSISVDALVACLVYPFGALVWSVTRENFGKALDSYILKAKERVDKLQIGEIKAAVQEFVNTLETIWVS